MCGLVGIAGDTTGAWKDVFSQLLLFDSVRGLHSTGAGFVARYNNDNDFTVVKRPGHPFNLFHAKEYEDAMMPAKSSKVILGHNRHATIGEKTESNAHPFQFEHVLGMHNGTLDKWSVKELHNYDQYGTDSEAVFATINQVGIDETMKRMSGAWALIWYDKRDKTLNFLRNDRRPLHYCYSEDRCTLIWASELEMLKYVMDRCRKKIEDDKIFFATKDTMFTWKIPDSINKKFDLPVQRQMKGKEYTYAYNTSPFKEGSTTYYPQKSNKHGSYGTTQNTTQGYSKPFSQKDDPKKFRPPYKDLYGRVISKKEFLPMVAEGCAFCDMNHQKWGEFVHVMGSYSGYHTPYLCQECYNTEETYDFTAYAI